MLYLILVIVISGDHETDSEGDDLKPSFLSMKPSTSMAQEAGTSNGKSSSMFASPLNSSYDNYVTVLTDWNNDDNDNPEYCAAIEASLQETTTGTAGCFDIHNEINIKYVFTNCLMIFFCFDSASILD